MKYLSVCSGIEAATVAWHSLGWEPAAFSEIEKFPSAVLAHRYPQTPSLGDMTQYEKWDIKSGTVDLLVGGTPCQSFSVAGLRKGLRDPRGNLALVYLGILDRIRPRWMVWENVPGVLSSNKGRDFGAFLGALAKLGYGWSYRVLDAQYVRVDSHGRAVPQRRRRVFVVGHSGGWQRAGAVLFESPRLSGNTPPSRTAGEGYTGDVADGVGKRGKVIFLDRAAYNQGRNALYSPKIEDSAEISEALIAKGPHAVCISEVAKTLSARHDSSPCIDRGMNFVAEVADTITANWHHSKGAKAGNQAGMINPVISKTLTARQGQDYDFEMESFIAQNYRVRRLTPLECERLQGFPDNWTQIPYRNKPAEECPDSPRYKAIGNSMAVNVMRWIGRRIQAVESL